MQVRSPGGENCLLYEELQSINMTGSSGGFSITLNDGSGTRLDSPIYSIDRIFANRDSLILDSTRCSNATSYAPGADDNRKLVVYFKDETMAAFDPLPILSLNFVPHAMYALEAKNIGDFSVNNILRAVDGSGNPANVSAFDPAQLISLNALIAGTSTQYASTSQFNLVQAFAKTALPTCNTGEVLKSNGASLSCVADSIGSSSPAYSSISGATSANTIDNANFAQTWNWSTATTQTPMTVSSNALTTGTALRVSTTSASLNSSAGLVNVSNTGTSSNGVLARFQSNSTAGSGLTILANGLVGIGTTAPLGDLHIAGSSGDIFLDWAGNNANGPALQLRKARGTLAAPAAAQNWDVLGAVTFHGYGGSTFTPIAQVYGVALENFTGTSKATGIGFSTTASGSIVNTLRAIIDANGSFGIGTMPINSSHKLEVSHDTAPTIAVSRNDTTVTSGESLGKLTFLTIDTDVTSQKSAGNIEVVSSQDFTTNAAAGSMIFRTTGATVGGSPAERMRITSNGYVGVGTSNPQNALDVNGSISIPITGTYKIGDVGILSKSSSGAVIIGDLTGDTRGTGSLDIQIGRSSATKVTSYPYSIAVGIDNAVHGSGGIALGSGNSVQGLAGVTVGTSNLANEGNLAVGVSNQSTATDSGAPGYSVAVGMYNVASGYNSIAIGNNVTNNVDNSAMFGPSDTAKITVLSNGNLGVGQVSPITKLHVTGASGSTLATFSDGGSTSCTVTPASTGFACSSDERLKKDIQSFSDKLSLEKILKLRTVTYNWKSVSNGRHTGYIAQELEKVASELVVNGTDGFKQVNYSGLIPWITGAIKALSSEFTLSKKYQDTELQKLKNENQELKVKVEKLENEIGEIKRRLGI